MKNWVKRAIRTFIQAAVGYAIVALPAIDWQDTSALRGTLIGLGVSAIAAGISAAMNYIDDTKM
ncbi:hypothetical protein RASY3_01705 [Ruminococcus albus SY3]|jgi:hypothetical protein|uniref:Holin n=1 Tax=Ruminococcus albus SY3 TaxID=1341156 RepID=A0A011W054_RUMAL|nr:hypothetical protein [Ruminococcus albus]EXM40961.1 hypothetical protein RASY3_01705 [Ruminococcus albus SY3]